MADPPTSAGRGVDDAVGPDPRRCPHAWQGGSGAAGPASRRRWLAIDPKPLAADPAFAVTPALWNRWEEALASGDLRAHLRRRLSIICEHAGLDEERAKAWSIIREVQMGLWAIEDVDADGLTKAISIIKAMQPD